MPRPPDFRVELFPEVSKLPPIPAFVRPSYRSIGMLGGCRSVPWNLTSVAYGWKIFWKDFRKLDDDEKKVKGRIAIGEDGSDVHLLRGRPH